MDAVDLEDARRRFPLPDGVDDVVVNRTQLAKALNTSENSLTKWLGKGMPCLQEGGNGRDYEFQMGDCYAWRMSVLEEERGAKARADAAAAQLAMLFANDDSDEDGAAARLTPKEIREQSEAQILRMKAAEMRGELVRASNVRATVERMLERVRRNMITLPDYAEREFSLSPAQVQAMERRAFAVLTDMRRDVEDLLAGGDVVGLDQGSDDPGEAEA